MKKVVFLASVLFLMSCGGESKDAHNDAKHEEHTEAPAKHEEAKHEEHAEEAPVVEEDVVEEEVVTEFSGDENLGETLFADKGCVACHAVDKKVVGPSLQDIAAGYDGDGAKIVSFLKEESDAIIDPEQFAVMQANLAMTKEMADSDLNAIAAYILKQKQ